MERFFAVTKATQKQSSILTFTVKASPVFVLLLSLPPKSKRPLKFQASYTMERKLEIWEFALIIFLSANHVCIWNATTYSFASASTSMYSMVFD